MGLRLANFVSPLASFPMRIALLTLFACVLQLAVASSPVSTPYRIEKIRIFNASIILTNSPTLAQQTADPSIIPDPQNLAIDVYNTPQPASATLRLRNLRYITSGNPIPIQPCTPSVARITSGIDTQSLECYSFNFNGVPELPLTVDFKQALAVLYIACSLSNDHIIRNRGASCVQSWYPKTQRVTLMGNRSIELVLNTAYMPRVIDLKNMTSWGAPGRSPTNTRIIIRTTQLQSAGDTLVTNATRVIGTLPYAVPDGAWGVILEGCRIQRIACTVTDTNSRNVCRYRDVCTTDAAAAKSTLLDLLNGTTPPCTPPPK